MIELDLAPQIEMLITNKIETGRYENASEVVSEALQRLEERDRAARLQQALSIGIDQLHAGQGVELTRARFDELVRQAENTAEMMNPIKAVVKPSTRVLAVLGLLR